MERKYIIYQHTTPSGKVYIGQTCYKNPNRRWANGKGYKGCKLFYCSIKKYGWDNIEHKILHTNLSKEQADILEKMYISFFKRKNISLNLSDGGEGGPLTAETRRKISETKKGKTLSAVHRRKISESVKGHIVSAETRRKLSEVNKGKTLSAVHRRKISESEKGKQIGPFSEEHRRKMSEAHKGKVLTPETRRKMSEAHKGRPLKRSIWLNEFNQEVEMAVCQAKHHHPNWIKVRDL